MPRLYRSQTDKKISGLCGGLAKAFDVDANLLRLIVVVAAVFSAGSVILLYILASLVIPKEPLPYYSNGSFDHGAGHGPRGHHGPYAPGGTYGPHGYPSGYPYGSASGPGAAGTGASMNADKPSSSELDDMMKDLETKALRQEIEQLKARLAKFENMEKGEDEA